MPPVHRWDTSRALTLARRGLTDPAVADELGGGVTAAAVRWLRRIRGVLRGAVGRPPKADPRMLSAASRARRQRVRSRVPSRRLSPLPTPTLTLIVDGNGARLRSESRTRGR